MFGVGLSWVWLGLFVGLARAFVGLAWGFLWVWLGLFVGLARAFCGFG